MCACICVYIYGSAKIYLYECSYVPFKYFRKCSSSNKEKKSSKKQTKCAAKSVEYTEL